MDFGVIVGAGLDMDLGDWMLTLDVRYNFGLQNVNESGGVDVKTGTITMLVGFGFL
jgi:hypothetical protein